MPEKVTSSTETYAEIVTNGVILLETRRPSDDCARELLYHLIVIVSLQGTGLSFVNVGRSRSSRRRSSILRY